jgi:hypothetical protein
MIKMHSSKINPRTFGIEGRALKPQICKPKTFSVDLGCFAAITVVTETYKDCSIESVRKQNRFASQIRNNFQNLAYSQIVTPTKRKSPVAAVTALPY